MTSSGTTSFNPSVGSVTLYAFNLAGLRNTEIVQEHLETARMAVNLLLGRLSAIGVNLWRVTQESVPLIQGVATYDIPSNNVVMLDTYIRTNQGNGQPIDRIIMPVSRTEYASYANKEQQGFPTTFWQNRQLSSTVTLWPVPDGTQTSLEYYQVIQIEDAYLTNGQTLDAPAYFLDCIAYGIAHRMALIWNPDRAVGLKALFDESYADAVEQNEESANFYIAPAIGSYFT